MNVEPRLRDIGECQCADSCGAYGTLKAPWRDGTRCVARKCRCKRCLGRQNRKRGLDKQRKAAKALGVTGYVGDEEHWQDELFASEVKSGHQANPAANAFLRIEAQVFANRADYGDRLRPCRAVLMPDDWGSEGLVMVRLSAWTDVVRPALEAHYGAGDAA